jgi:hypothetical protein
VMGIPDALVQCTQYSMIWNAKQTASGGLFDVPLATCYNMAPSTLCQRMRYGYI